MHTNSHYAAAAWSGPSRYCSSAACDALCATLAACHRATSSQCFVGLARLPRSAPLLAPTAPFAAQRPPVPLALSTSLFPSLPALPLMLHYCLASTRRTLSLACRCRLCRLPLSFFTFPRHLGRGMTTPWHRPPTPHAKPPIETESRRYSRQCVSSRLSSPKAGGRPGIRRLPRRRSYHRLPMTGRLSGCCCCGC